MSSYISTMSANSNVEAGLNTTRNYICPKCNKNYDFQMAGNNFVGRIPLILNCKHTICQECVHKMYPSKDIICAECRTSNYISDIEAKKKADHVFTVNFYVFGALAYHKRYGCESSNINFKPAGFQFRQPHHNNTQQDTKPNSFLSFNVNTIQQNFGQFAHLRVDVPQHVCSQESCNKEAKLTCTDCDELYCTQCSDTIHNQAKGLKKHKINPLTSGDCLELTDTCAIHSHALLEFFCITCEKNLCCYCILSDHQGHGFRQMTQLTDGNLDEFKNLVENAEEILRRLMISEEKIRRLLQKPSKSAAPDNTVELLISKKIKNAIAKLQMLEKDLLSQMQKIRNEDRISLTTLQEQLITNIRSISNLISIGKQATDTKNSSKKINLHLLKTELEGLNNTPCYFLQNEKESSDLEFLFEDTLIEDLQHSARLNFQESNPYSLVTRQELPADYEDNDDTISISKSILSSTSSLIDSMDSKLTREKPPPKKMLKTDCIEKWLQSTTPSLNQHGKRSFPAKDKKDQNIEMPTFQKGDRETVRVTHLMSPDCFYVQLGKMSACLMRLSKAIDKHIKSKSVIVVQAPEINDLYLVKYMSDGVIHWCRGRVIEYLPEQKLYTVYFIDYGNTATVRREDIGMIPPDLKRLIPFAIKCKFFDLYPAKGNSWDSNAVLTMAKIISNNELLMIITEVSAECLEVDLLTTDCDTSLRDALKFLGYGIPYCKYPTDLDRIKKQLKNTETVKLYPNVEQFKREESVDVIISYAINPYNIYVNLKNSRNDLIKLHETMDNFYRENKKGYIYSPREDMVVAVLYSDAISSSWRRGIITQSSEGRGMVTVKLVDIGMTISVPWDQVRKLDGRFAAQYCQAKLVKMAHVKPPNGTDFWPPNAVDFFTKFVKSETTLKMVVNEVGNPPEVVFFECFPSIHNCLNAMLVKSDFAESTGDLSSTVEWPQFDHESKKEDESFTISMMKTIQATNHHLQDTSAKDDDVDSDEEGISDNIYRKPIEVISVESPDLIYVTFTDNKQKLHEFHLELKHFYTKTKLTPAHWEVGHPCVVYHRKRYYRGIISEVLSNERYLVSLKDCAINVEVKGKHIGILDERFTKDPQFAIRCHLADVVPAGGTGKWSRMACEFLQDTLKNNESLYLARKGELDKERKSMPVLIWFTEFLPGGALESSKTILHLVNKLLLKNGLALKPAALRADHDIETLNKDVETDERDRDSIKSVSTETEDHECSSSVSSNSVAGALMPSTSKVDWNDLIEMQKQCPEQIIRDWMPPLQFAKDEFKAVATFVNDSGEIFLHDVEMEPLLKQMEEEMHQYFQTRTDFDVDGIWSPGEMCSVRYFLNKKWYRGKVLSVNDSSIKVVMVDYGNEDDCSPLDLSKEILFYDVPIIANRIVLDGVFPRENQWLTSDLDVLHAQIVDKHVNVRLVSQQIIGLPTPAIVTLDTLNINDFIIQNSKNLSKINLPKPKQPSFTIPSNSDVFPINDTFDGLNSQSDNDVIIDESGSSCNENPTKNVTQHSTTPITTTIGKLELNYKQSPLPQIKSGEKFEIVIINVPDYNKIVFELPSSEHFEKGKQLFEDMSREINFLSPEQESLESFEEGRVCIALFPEDNQWYRGQIVNELNAEEVYVWFVDFGNFECLNKKHVKQLRNCWLEVPVEHHIATIYGIRVVDEKNHQEVLDEMISYCEACQLAKIILDKPLSIELYKKDAADVLSYQNLIDSGLLEIVDDGRQVENEVKQIQISA